MHIILRNFRTSLKQTLLRFLTFMLVFGAVFAQGPVSSAHAAGTDLTLTKTVEGGITTAQVGDVIRYRLHFACSNLTTPCGPMEITDVLQAGLIYQPPPASSVPAGFSINYAPATRTITITKDDSNLLDGSQYDAVIAVQVDYDLRPLPAVINNTVNGRIAPTGPGNWEVTTPASAPPITIGTVTPSWGMTKTLSSPIINPTVNTDVTYQIQLCPTAPPPGQGNVPLRNITITDNLPTGATFISASNGGMEAGGVVTWPLFAGPVYPPSCLTRFVTIRYNSATFSIGNNVTNTASTSAQYTDSGGGVVGPLGVATDPITHTIDPISEIPTYSKDDVGDPIGFTGTGRFILNLNTNGTNYPSDQLILIDNMPPQLQVTSVASGQWSAAFDYVHAFVEYSTNNGSSYTAFPGQPISYNTNATYAAPAANITNVRWRFEYDPDKTAPFTFTQAGLPYTWAFTTSPEIRVIPRATATTASAPSGAAMPAAVAGTTYNNCLQVTRTNSSGNPVTDACNIEQMTVQGTIVSLRTSKDETPGTSWDDLLDPTITTFTADGSILPGDTLKYTITIEVTERSSTPLVNPTIQDTLPAATDFVFVRNGIAALDGTPLAQQPTFTQAGQVLTWAWNNPSPTLTVNPLPLGSHFLTVEFYARVPRGQAPGTYTNDLYTVTDSLDAVCENGTTLQDSANGDVDGDADATDPACRAPDTYVVERSAALRGEKWIRSTDALNSQVVNATTFLPDASCPNGGTTGLGGSNPFTRYPCISQAFPEGALPPGQFAPPTLNTTIDDFEYNLRIFNDGNVPMLSYVLYDILPYVGDTGSGGTLFSSSRLSEFRPVMRGPVQFISGPSLTSADFTIEYNNTTNPCRPEVFDQPSGLVPGGCNNTWTTTWSASALSYRIRLNAGSIIPPAATSSEVRFGVPMYIPADASPAGFDPNDALSHEIAWNSFAHVGSYDKDPTAAVDIQDLLASEPRKVGITVPERMSVGNRVWRDADNSGTINAPDDTNPGIAGVTVNLYRDADNNGIADGAAIATTTTDSGGYYLFSNIPYDSAVANNNRYIIGIPSSNFAPTFPLESLRSSTGTPAVITYTNPPSTNGDNNDNGIDPVTPGQEVFSASFTLQPTTEPAAEFDLSANDRDGLPGQRRGTNGERDTNSDLTIDFGFFGGTDVPFSIGNHVWKDNGQTATAGVFNYAQRNDGIRQTDEPPVAGALVRLYRDGNANGIPEAAEMIRTDITDANGFYLFDNLDPGPYFVEIPASNFATGQPLAGWYNSQPTGTETVGVNGGITTADIDNDDNGINNNFPEINGIFSGVVVLVRGTPEPIGETYLSSDTSSAPGYNPTAGDGPGHIGRFGEQDGTSNVTIDFGFIPPMSLGNRVWIDEGAGTTPFRTGYNNGLQDGTEVGVSGVTIQLWRDTNGTPGLQVTGGTPDTLMDTDTTDATGYYLFERLQPANNYFVYIPGANFTGAGALVNFLSSTGAPASADIIDKNDNGIDSATPATTGITSQQITMSYNGEPLTPANETDINTSGTYGPLNVGNYGQQDGDSNLTMDFGFVRPPRSIGNRLWIDTNNNGQVDGGEAPVPTGVRVSLYLDANADGIPDDFNGDTILDNNDALGFDLTDANGYYLFDDLPPNNYIVGVDRLNFVAGGLLDGYNSSTGSVDNLTNNTDNRDNGVDRLLRADPVASPHGILSTCINLTTTPVNAPTGEVGSGDTSNALGFNPTAGDGTNSRGRFGETDANSDLTIDFGFFIPMSLGNRVFLDDGTGGGTYNNGIMDGGETPIANVRVELWRDANANGIPDAGGMVGFDTTDAGGYYLFDDLTEGSYVVLIAGSNFTGAGPLVGRSSSTPTGTENAGVAGNPYTPNTDRDDNGINNGSPATTPAATPGVLSGTIVLVHNAEPTGEIELSGQADPGSPANLAFSPTGWDGPNSRGRWDEIDANSNLTIDFGFIPVFSLGNRVWFDTNNNSAINGAEAGVNGVVVQLYDAVTDTQILVGADGILGTADDLLGGNVTTANGGYYLFNNLPAGDYYVVIPASNFTGVLRGYWSSGTTMNGVGTISEVAAPDADIVVADSDDNGTRQNAGPLNGAVISLDVTLGPTITSEPAGEADLNATLPGNRQGQPDQQANMTVDFGFYRVQIGNLVYLDNNANGTNDAGDTAITGRAVRLYAADGTTEINVGPDGILGTADDAAGGMPTNVTGNYLFSGLPQGQYVVKTVSDAVTKSTIDTSDAADNATPDTNRDNNDNGIGIAGGTVSSGVLTMTPGFTGALNNNTVNNGTGTTLNPTLDFGFVGLVGIGNRVWFDNGAGGGISNNGVLDGTEAGVANVTVELYTSTGTFVSSTTTDATGHYQFDLLNPGTYYTFIPAVEFQAGGDLFSYYSSVSNSANETSDEVTGPTTSENGIDDAAPATNGIRSTNFTLLAGTESTTDDDTGYTGTLPDNSVNFTDDFGFVQKYSIGNRVWFDTNNGSTINGAEVGVDGVTVNLYAAGNLGVILATDTTSNGGYYLFDDLYPGDYVVSVAASNFAGVLNGYWSSGTSRTAAGAITETAAAVANSDTDSDDNGTRQTAGPLNGAVISSTVTLGPSGNTEPALETDLEPVVGQGNQVDGRANMTVDFGFYKTEIGNLVFADADNNGNYNAGDTLLQNVTVQLYAANGTTLLATTTTNAIGEYRFNGQPEGDYVVKVVTPTGMTSTIDTSDSADNANPDVNTDNNDNGIGQGAGTVSAGALTMTAAEGAANITINNATGTTTDLTVDFGFVPLYSLGNRVWFDTNNNSLMDAGEVGVNGVVVQLYNADGLGNPTGAAIATDTTTGGGFYLFDDLSPRDYVVVITQANFAPGGALAGYWSSATSLTAGGTVTETAAPDADTTATDADDNGTLVSGGVFNGAVISSAVTLGPSGGTEPIGEIAGQLESGVLGNQGNQPDDRANMTVDFGFYRVEIGNLVYLDANGNGNYDGAPDTVIANARVQLFASNGTTQINVGPDGILGTADDAAGGMLTDAGGLYHFTGLPAGNYIVKTVTPTGMTSTIDTFSPADTTAPDTNVNNNDNGVGIGFGTVAANTLTMSAGEVAANIAVTNANGTTVDNTVDFGFVGQVAIGNRIWFDTGAGGGISNNGILDGTESGVPNLSVELYTSTGTLVTSTTTDANGYYQFDQLYPGTYYVSIPANQFQAGGILENYFSSFGNGTNETSDENLDENGIDDAAPATNGIRSINYTLTPGTEVTGEAQTNYTGVLADNSVNFTADFGFTQKYSIGNRVWFDTDNSGTINGAEVGIDGVTVNLYAAGNLTTILATDVTSAGGYYLFDDLYPGDYVVAVAASNFTGVLNGYLSSGTTISNAGILSETLAPDADVTPTDDDDNGTLQTGGVLNGAVISQNVTLGPTGDTEPTGETDLETIIGDGNQTDGRANMTVDFGFYTTTLGNLVWNDTDKNGAFNGAETGIDGVTVTLWSGDGTLQLATTTTAGGGLYNFPGLAQGNYTIQVTTPAGTVSTVDTFAPTDTTNPTTNTDNNDNGVGTGTGTIVSNVVTLTAGAAQTSNTVNNATGSTANPTIDFGLITIDYSLGNRVWFDTDNSGTINGTEVGISGVRVEVYQDNGGTPGVYDGTDTFLAFATTDASGYYRFDGLPAGDYVVVIPKDNFQDIGAGDNVPGNPLSGYWSSETTVSAAGVISDATVNNPNNNIDSDDNGRSSITGTAVNSVASAAVTLGPGTVEPTGETDLSATGQGTLDNLANMTVDFGFYRQQVSNQVFIDINNNGTYDAGDTALAGATVQLFASDGVTEINVGPDGILGTADDATGGVTTGAGGTYLFSGLPQGDYIVKATPPVGYASAVDTADGADTTNPNTNTDNNDNGVGAGAGQASSNVVTLTPGNAGTAANNIINNATATTTNPTVDFGFVSANGIAKIITGTSETFTSGNDVAIGEIVTYRVVINLPVGIALSNVTVTDHMDKGLAFVDCSSVILAGANVTATVCPPAVSSITDPGDLSTNPANPGRQVQFNIGNIPAPAVASTLVIEYRAIVLDVIENQQGVTLNNDVTWAWTGGSFSTSAPNVTILEPDLNIKKSAAPSKNIAAGTPILFTITIAHTASSNTDAFDVDVTDALPAGLDYIPCTLSYTGLIPTTSPVSCTPTTNLSFSWDSFPLGQTATITFNGRLNGTTSSATNTASVAWSTLPIDTVGGVPVQLSTYNVTSTERLFDPSDPVDVYQVLSSVTINPPAAGGATNNEDLPGVLPLTGFAPDVVTPLPEQPKEKLYTTTDVWMEIPSLGVNIPIVGVPLVDGDWNVSWLDKQAGWLNGTAFPGWQGNSVLTGHVYLSNGKPGPFVGLGQLKWGDKVFVHAYGSVYTYEVRENRTVSPTDTSVLKHEADSWLTLITCKSYNESTNSYANRIAVRAVLVNVQLENTPKGGR